MEDVVNRIIAIDNDTKKVIKMTEKIKRDSEFELKNRLVEMEKTLMEEARIIGDKEFKIIIAQGISEIDKLKENEKSKLNYINNVYKGKKDELVEEIFQNLLKENE